MASVHHLSLRRDGSAHIPGETASGETQASLQRAVGPCREGWRRPAEGRAGEERRGAVGSQPQHTSTPPALQSPAAPLHRRSRLVRRLSVCDCCRHAGPLSSVHTHLLCSGLTSEAASLGSLPRPLLTCPSGVPTLGPPTTMVGGVLCLPHLLVHLSPVSVTLVVSLFLGTQRAACVAHSAWGWLCP